MRRGTQPLLALAATALAAVTAPACSPGAGAEAQDSGIDAGTTDTDVDADADADTDTDADTDECLEDGSTECGDGGDTDTWSPDSGEFCDSPEFQAFLAAAGYAFDDSAAPWQGNALDPEVVITGFSFFYCPHCATAGEMIRDLLDDSDYGDRCAYRFRNYVYDMTPPSFGCTAHRAAWAAHQQGLFWEVHDGIFDSGEVVLAEGDLFDLAAAAGCDMELFAADYDAPATLEQLAFDKAQGQDAGVDGTPTIFVDGKKVYPWDALPQVLDCLLGYAD
jgi:protein-disulfide isomerase